MLGNNNEIACNWRLATQYDEPDSGCKRESWTSQACKVLVNTLHPYVTVCNLIKENGITQCIKVQIHIFIVFEVFDIFKVHIPVTAIKT
jgi:hypothetical protein